MSLISCPECSASVSDVAFTCPQCSFELQKPKRGFFGKLFKWGFIIFNALMLVWFISFMGNAGEVVNSATNDAEQAGAAIGATLGTGMILGVWVFGDIILGLFVLFTKPKKG